MPSRRSLRGTCLRWLPSVRGVHSASQDALEQTRLPQHLREATTHHRRPLTFVPLPICRHRRRRCARMLCETLPGSVPHHCSLFHRRTSWRNTSPPTDLGNSPKFAVFSVCAVAPQTTAAALLLKRTPNGWLGWSQCWKIPCVRGRNNLRAFK